MDAFQRFGGIVAGALLLSACASVSVRPTAEDTETRQGRRPVKIVVCDFDYPGDPVHVDREGQELDLFKRQFARQLSYDLVAGINQLGIPGEILFEGKPDSQAAWLVTGHFKLANQGSRALRSLIGFGSGGTKLKTEIAVYDLSLDSTLPIFTFETNGGSGASPGAILSSNPFTFTASAAEGAIAGLSDDRKRTARMIVAYLSEQLWMDNALGSDQVSPAKRDGSWATFDARPEPDNPPPVKNPGKRNGVRTSSK